jgi:hypothetical protein
VFRRDRVGNDDGGWHGGLLERFCALCEPGPSRRNVPSGPSYRKRFDFNTLARYLVRGWRWRFVCVSVLVFKAS